MQVNYSILVGNDNTCTVLAYSGDTETICLLGVYEVLLKESL